MKKLLFGLGILPLAALPVLTIVSCGTSNGEIGDGEIPRPDPDSSTDLKITAKPLTQIVIDKAIANFNKNGITDAIKITALQTVFDGVTSEKFKNFEVKAIPTAGTILGTITLTAKPGFSFGIQSSLTSTVILDLKITAIPSTQTTIDKAILDFNSATTDPNKIKALSTVFTGITPENFKNITYKAIPTSGSTPGTITLTPKTNFTINGKNTLTSNLLLDLKITPIKVAQTIIDKSIADFNLASTDANKISALQTTFNGITPANFKNFDVTATPGTVGTAPGTIVLTVKPGFIFGTSKTLSSKVLGTNLDEELDKFSTPVETKTPTTLATEAANSIVIATDATARRKALELLVDLPTLSAGFDFEVKSAKVNTTTDTQIDVSIAVTEQATSTTKNTIFKVIGLKGAPTLDEEAAKFSPTETKTPTTLATEAANSIATAKDAKAKKAALEVLVDLPTLSTGFDFVVKSATVNNENPTSINVAITVTHEAGTPGSKEIIFIVTGLQATPAPTLDEEAAKFSPTETKTPTTLATEAAKSIDDAIGATAKRTALEILVDLPKLSDGFIFIVSSANVNTTNDTSIDVNITLIEQATGTPKDILFIVNGLKATPAPTPTLEDQANKFTTFTATNAELLVAEAIQSINDVTTPEEKTNALNLLATLPVLSSEFTFAFKSVAPTSGSKTSIDVTITITEKATSKNLDKLFTITGFKAAPTLQDQIDYFTTFITTKEKWLVAEAIQSINDVTTPEEKTNALNLLATLPVLSSEFTFAFKSVAPTWGSKTSIDVTITITEKATSNTIDKFFTITGFKEPVPGPTLDDEAGRFLTPVETKDKTILATEAAKSINDGANSKDRLNALQVLTELPPLSAGFALIVNSAKVNTTTDTSIDVSITIIKETTRTRKDITFRVIGLKGAPTLDREAAKFTPIATLTPETTTTNAIQSINNALDANARLAALKVLANVPTLSAGFDFEVKSAIVSTTTNTSIEVSIDVFQEAGSHTKPITFTITGLTTADKTLDITATPSAQTKIDEAIKQYKEAVTDTTKQLEALKLVFTGSELILENLDKFEVTIPTTPEGKPGTIVLTAKDGFAFGASKTLSSTLIINLNITPKPSTQSVIDKAIANLAIALNPTEEQKIAALQTVFDGITPENFKNINKIKPIVGTEGKPGTITITGKNGVTFNGVKILTSSLAPIVDFKITAKPSTKEQIDEAILDYTYAGNDANKIIALSMLFEGITSDVFSNLNQPEIILSTLDKPGKITLTSKEGYTINDKTSLSSEIAAPTLDEEAAKFKPTKTLTPSTTTTNAIKSITEAAGADAKLVELNRLVNVPTPSDGFTFEVKSAKVNATTPTSIDVSITVTEIATSKTQNVTFTITGLTGDLKITSTPSTQTTIDQAIENFNANGATNANKIAALQTVFAGITIENFKNFNVDVTTTPGTIVLIAKPGFAINGKTTLSSVPLTNLAITAKPSTQTTINQVITAITTTGATDADKISALQSVFDGITPDNFANLDVTTPTGTPRTIVLTAKSGFVINGQETLSSWAIVDLKITATPSTEEQIDTAIVAYGSAGNDADKIIVLSMLFKGINSDVFSNLNQPEIILSTLDKPGKITLTSKEGYTINDKTSLSSEIAAPTLDEEAAKFKPTKTLTPSTTTTIAIESINKATGAAAKLVELNRLVNVPKLSTGFEIEVKSAKVNATTPTSIDVSITVTEIATSKTQNVTFTITGLTGDLIITSTPSNQATIDQAIINFNKTGATDANKIVALQSVFAGITIENFKNLDVLATPTTIDGTPGTIVLTVKPGFMFGTSKTLSSVLLIDLPISAPPVESTLIDKAITDFNKATTDPDRITALQPIFGGITSERFAHFKTKATPGTGGTGTIVLTANHGYTINGKRTLTSNSLKGIDLKIIVAENKIISQEIIDKAITDINGTTQDDIKITALQTIFDGVTAENFDKFTIEATATVEPMPGKVVLTAVGGFNFGNEPTLTSMIVESLEGQPSQISAKRVAQTIIDKAITDIDKPGATEANKITALQTVFDHITADNFKKFTIEAKQSVGPEFGTIILTAKPGFIFGTSKTLSSIINLPITAKSVAQQVINDAVAAINASGANDNDAKIAALSKVFDGITVENFKNFETIIEGSTGYWYFILLPVPIAKYAFDGEDKLFSEALPATPPTIEHKINN